MVDIAERLALIIDAKTSGAVTELQRLNKSAESTAVAQDRVTLSAAKMTAAQDKLAASVAKSQVAEAKASGDTAALAAAQTEAAAAVERANLSKAQAAIASDRLAVSELAAAETTAALGATATATAGMMEGLGLAGLSVGGALATLGPMLPLIAIAAGLKVLTDGIKHFEDLTAAVRKFEAVTGASAETSSLFIGRLKQLGVDPEVATKALARLGAQIGDGSTKLDQYGIAIARTKDGNVDVLATFENLRTAYQQSTDASTRDAIAKQLGARQLTALLPLLKLTKEQMQDLDKATRASGGIVTDEDTRNARQLAIAGREMKESFEHLEIQLTKGVVPLLAKAAELAATVVNSVSAGSEDNASQLGREAGVFRGKPPAGSAEAKQAAADAIESAKKQQDAEDKLTQSLLGEMSAKKAVRDASNSLVDARQAEVDAQDKLNKLLKDGAVDEKEVAAAKKDLESASKSLARAQESERDAVEALNKARERATALEMAEAQNKIALAGDRIGGAKAAEQQAQEKLDALIGSGDATAGQVAAAQAELKTRHDEVTQSLLDQQQATEDLTDLKRKGTEQDPAVISAERRVRDAHDEVKTAIDNQRDALDKLHEAEAGDPDYARKLADARKDLARAHQAISDAQLNQISTAVRLKTATENLNTALAGTGGALMALQTEQAVLDQLLKLSAKGYDVGPLLSLLPDVTSGHDYGFGITNPFGTPALHRAKGGPLEPYHAYLVAEPGTGGEILVMGDSGGYAMPAGHRGAVVHSHLHVEGLVTSAAIQAIARENAWQIRTTVLPRIE